MIVQPKTVADLFVDDTADTIALPNQDTWDQFAELAQAEFDRLMEADARFRHFIQRETLH